MDPTPYFIMGAIFGTTATLAIQWFANRRVRKALAAVAQAAPARPDDELQRRETLEMSRRLAVLEQIITDHPRQLAHDIDRLR